MLMVSWTYDKHDAKEKEEQRSQDGTPPTSGNVATVDTNHTTCIVLILKHKLLYIIALSICTRSIHCHIVVVVVVVVADVVWVMLRSGIVFESSGWC
jgi:hypothetical protein